MGKENLQGLDVLPNHLEQTTTVLPVQFPGAKARNFAKSDGGRQPRYERPHSDRSSARHSGRHHAEELE